MLFPLGYELVDDNRAMCDFIYCCRKQYFLYLIQYVISINLPLRQMIKKGFIEYELEELSVNNSTPK